MKNEQEPIRLLKQVKTVQNQGFLRLSVCLAWVKIGLLTIVENVLSALKSLKCFISLWFYKDTFRMLLTCIFLVLVSMFSLLGSAIPTSFGSWQQPGDDTEVSAFECPLKMSGRDNLYIASEVLA